MSRHSARAHAAPASDYIGSEADDTGVVSSSGHAGHAFLHDFCMAIPYGIAVGLAGIIALCLKQFSLGLAFIGAAAAVEYMAVLSLKCWKRQSSSASLTSATAVVAAGVTAALWQQVPQRTWAAVVLRGTTAMSALLLIFFIYNVAAGGNPPKEEKPEKLISASD